MADKTHGSLFKPDVVPDFGGLKVEEMMGFAENPLDRLPPALIQPVPAA